MTRLSLSQPQFLTIIGKSVSPAAEPKVNDRAELAGMTYESGALDSAGSRRGDLRIPSEMIRADPDYDHHRQELANDRRAGALDSA